MRARCTVRLVAWALAAQGAVGAAQDPPSETPASCDISASLLVPHGRNMFTPGEEMHLGDVAAEHVEANFRVIDDPEANRRLRSLGQRIAAHMPGERLDVRFAIVDTPTPVAFALPGGHIYVSQKLVGVAQGEDELAGALAREIAHAASGRPAIVLTDAFRRYLDVTEVRGWSDIRQRYHEYVDAVRHARRRRDPDEVLSEQARADRLGLYAAAKAGYDPAAYASMLERVTIAEALDGDVFLELLGTFRSDPKRLRKLHREMRAFWRSCSAYVEPWPGSNFAEFRALVLADIGQNRAEALEGLVANRALREPLPTTLRELRFSPDGRHVLARDERAVYIYTRDPFELSFSVDARDAASAHFTPDSRSFVWLDRSLRVERWSLDERRLEGASGVVVFEGCLQPSLSPDGSVLACFTYDGAVSLRRVSSGRELFVDNRFPTRRTRRDRYFTLEALLKGARGALWTGFSPDGRYFLAAQPPRRTLAVDVVAERKVSLRGSLAEVLHGGFAFLDGQRVAAVHPKDPSKSGVFAFPSGHLLKSIELAQRSVEAAARGDYLLARRMSDRQLDVMDLDTKRWVLRGGEQAFDIYGDEFVSQHASGELRLQRLTAPASDGARDVEVLATAELPPSRLDDLQAAVVSADLELAAISVRSHGGLWNLRTGERLTRSRGFRGAVFFGPTLYADFPKSLDAERKIVALTPNGPREGPKIEAPHLRQIGDLLLGAREIEDGMVVDALRVQDLEPLWSREVRFESRLDRSLRWFVTPRRIALAWPGESRGAKRLVDADPGMKERYRALDDSELVPVIEIVDARTGETEGSLLMGHIHSSGDLEGLHSDGDTVVASLKDHRVLVYSLSTGELVGRLFGRKPVVSSSVGLLGIEHQADFVLYRLPSLEEARRYRFAAPIASAVLHAETGRLFVLTDEQIAYVLELPEP